MLPTPSLTPSIESSFSTNSGFNNSSNVLAVAPLGISLPSPLKPYGDVGSFFSSSRNSLGKAGSKETFSTTPSGSSVGSTVNGKLFFANNTSTICPYAANVFVLVTLINTRDFSASVNCTSGPYIPR